MADISMDYASVEDLVKELLGMKEDLTDALDALDTMVSSLNGNWKGNAHKKFVSTYQKLEPDLRTMCDSLGDYEKQINAVIAEQKDTEATTAASISSKIIPSF